MRINNITSTGAYYNRTAPQRQLNEIVVINRKPNFQSKANVVKKSVSIVTETGVNKSGINMCCAVKNPVKLPFQPAPETLDKRIASFLNSLEVDWRTHVDPNKPKRSFE